MALEFEVEEYGFDLDNAHFLATACDLASRQANDELPDKINDKLGLDKDTITSFELIEPEDLANYGGFVGSSEALTVLAFRDVDDITPWLTDATIVQKPGFGGEVHKGFSDGIEAVWDEFADVVKEQTENRPLWITGHGLGGALALLAAVRFATQGIEARAVYTFGAPRVGDRAFFHAYPAVAYRVVNNNDILTHVPAEDFPIGGYNYCDYKHVGSLVYFNRHKRINEGTSNWSEKKTLIGEQLRTMSQPPTQWFQDHLLSSYLEVIKDNV